jgi:hypothetical protein
MYYMTGLPGWMRFGFSPGWVGRSPSGLGPCAEYLMSGQWPTPQMQAAWQGGQVGQMPMMPWGQFGAAPDPRAQLEFLKSQAQMLSQQLEQVRAQIESLAESQ